MLAREHHQVVLCYIETVQKASLWAREHKEETIKIFSKELFGNRESTEASFPSDLHTALEPEISEEGMLSLNIQKQFLLEHGYREKNFSIEK